MEAPSRDTGDIQAPNATRLEPISSPEGGRKEKEEKSLPWTWNKRHALSSLASGSQTALFTHKISRGNYRIMAVFGKQTWCLEVALALHVHYFSCGQKGGFVLKFLTEANQRGCTFPAGHEALIEAMKNYKGAKQFWQENPLGEKKKRNSSFIKASLCDLD